jgi:hypothetical protein
MEVVNFKKVHRLSLYISSFPMMRVVRPQGIWKAKIPLKIKIFIWMVAQKAILTKDNMIIRN